MNKAPLSGLFLLLNIAERAPALKLLPDGFHLQRVVAAVVANILRWLPALDGLIVVRSHYLPNELSRLNAGSGAYAGLWQTFGPSRLADRANVLNHAVAALKFRQC